MFPLIYGSQATLAWKINDVRLRKDKLKSSLQTFNCLHYQFIYT